MLHEAFILFPWFINFDGLDEVPNDVKDQIADEINRFTNELIPMLDADFLVLATTRPQGYSGQFQKLNASDVTLLPLPPEIAIECATPVIKFNRSPEEAESSLTILKSAMQSEQVKELMTTPLQSHIMAIVVRDGGRPPEKRWTLYNNFYSVMKKRESLKSFPDQKIQSLLREQDQLLKSIHDRLGISLHAKAERSKGAESALDRIEFEKLAKQTVEKQIDHNVSTFVSTLMDATTERLVFVNTPDNSESVRFDIRQLQEFFAAEFIYTAVSNEELRSRIILICGDAHWREVIHFVLSALIAHQKLGELSVAVTIMQSLDDDSHNNVLKSFKKNLGVGALLALRLLNEGVLEEDRQIRQPFSKLLLPIWNMIEHDSILQIVSVKKEQSKHWLLNNLIETMVEMDYSEHLISGYLASIIITKDHPRLDEVKGRIYNAPDYYLSATYSLHRVADRDFSTTSIDYQDWFIEFTIDLLFENRNLSKKSLRSIINFLTENKKTINDKIKGIDIGIDRKSIIKAITHYESTNIFDNKDTNHNNEDKYCFVSVEYMEKNWNTNPVNDIIEGVEIEIGNLGLYLSLVVTSINFYVKPDVDNFRAFLVEIKKHDYDTFIVPDFIKAMTPLNFERKPTIKQVDNLLKLDDKILSELLSKKGTLGYIASQTYHALKINNEEFNKEKWESLCTDHPDAAVSISFNEYLTNDGTISNAKNNHTYDFYNPVLQIILADPQLFSRYFFRWHEVFKLFPNQEQELRFKLMQTKPSSDNMFYREPLTSAFKFKLPEENRMIVHLASSLFNVSFFAEYLHLTHVHLNVENYNTDYLSMIGLTEKYLIDVALNEKEDFDIRASALACFISLTQSDKNNHFEVFFENNLDTLLINLTNEDTAELLAKSLFVFLFNVQNVDERFKDLLGAFSLKIKNKINIRIILQGIYKRWRERSSAPIESGNHLNKWLNYIYS